MNQYQGPEDYSKDIAKMNMLFVNSDVILLSLLKAIKLIQ